MLQVCSDGGCWPGEAGGRPGRSWAASVLGWRDMWLSVVGPELEEKANMRDPGINEHVLPLWD